MHDNDADTFGLVGDFIDGWSLRRRFHWPQSHNDVVQKILRKGRKGSEIPLIPGNHDEFMEFLLGLTLGHILVKHEYSYTDAKGRKFLVIHGHQFDVRVPIWLMKVGSWFYDYSVWLNHIVHKVRDYFNLPHWSLSNYLKKRTKEATSYVSNFKVLATAYAKAKGYDGVICGHIHDPKIEMIGDMIYMNCGDWVEHCTALVEDEKGNWMIIQSPRRG
jgi:UDP-2,3-diacylglucosamine pyrophosphatase LpxH